MGLLTSIIIIFAKQNNSEDTDIKIRLMNITEHFKNNGKLHASLDSLIYYKSFLHKNPKFEFKFSL